MERKIPAYISLFSGAGGLDLGLEMAGWHAAYASDLDASAVATLRANVGFDLGGGLKAFKGTFIEQADVTSIEANGVLAKAGLRRGDVPLLAGGPPCQSWSSAGHQLGFEDPRGRLFGDFVRMANGIDARWILLENVRGLLTARGPDGQPGSALSQIRHSLLRAGFQTTVGLLNAADFGVPQRRVRLFMVGFRTGDAPPFPTPTHAKRSDLSGAFEWVPLVHALASVPDLGEHEVIRPVGKMASDLADIAPGTGVKSPGKAERTRPSGHWGYKQGAFVADLSQPARTVTASTAQDWVRDPIRGLRRLSPRECAAVQSFPPSWQFKGNTLSQYRLIGNAVPPRLAKAIGETLAASMHLCRSKERIVLDTPLPLSAQLAYHVRYTAREEATNGESRREGATRRVSKLVRVPG